MSSISVVIPTENRTREAERCVQAILAGSVPPDEIILIDSSDDCRLRDRLEALQRLSTTTKIKYVHRKAGLTIKKNMGLRESQGDIILFVDDDVILDADYIKEILKVFSNDRERRIGGVIGQRVDPRAEGGMLDRLHQALYQPFAKMFLLLRDGDGRFQPSGFATTIRYTNTDKPIRVEYLMGGNTSFRREVIAQFGFDESLPGGWWGEDDDIAYRVSRRFMNILVPTALYYHRPLSTIKGEYDRMKSTVINQYYLIKKNFRQNFTTKFSFIISVLGLFVVETVKSILRRNSTGLRGLANGIAELIRGRSS